MSDQVVEKCDKKCEELKNEVKKELGIEELEMYEEKKCAKTDCYRNTIFLRNGKIIKPVKIRHSRTYTTFYKWYRKRDIQQADVVLEIYISNSGKHYCSIKVIKFNLQSLRRAISIHSCEEINRSLLEYIENNNIQLNTQLNT